MEARVAALLAQPQSELGESLRELLEEKASLEQKVSELEEEVSTLSANQKEPAFEEDVCPAANPDEADTQPMDDQEEKILYHEGSLQHLEEGKTGQEEEVVKDKPSKSACWNCGEGHVINDCPQPRDGQRIAAARKEFMKNQPASVARYHVDEPQKFGHLRPGLPSKKLKEALGLRDNQLPSYIYRLRDMGYPPGWKAEAQIKSSGMALYLSDKTVLGDMADEDGEIAEVEDKIQYDFDKLQEWPGFNSPMPEKFRDETDYYRVRPINPEQSKDEMVRELQPKTQKGYVRGEMADTSCAKDEDEEVEPAAPGSELEPVKVDQRITGATDSKMSEVGTPIVKMYSPFDSLPEQSKWANGTTDHILFENLPDSTGHWENMKDVIKRGRKSIQKMKTAEEVKTAEETKDTEEGEAVEEVEAPPGTEEATTS